LEAHLNATFGTKVPMARTGRPDLNGSFANRAHEHELDTMELTTRCCVGSAKGSSNELLQWRH
jgi:hypothetical protein